MKNFLAFVILLFGCTLFAQESQEPKLGTAVKSSDPDRIGKKGRTANEELEYQCQSYYDWNFSQYPEWSTYNGVRDLNGKLTDQSASAEEIRKQDLEWFLKFIRDINYEDLSEANKLNYDLFERLLVQDVEAHQFKNYLMPLSQQGGLHISMPQIIEYQPMNNLQDYKYYFERLHAFPVEMDKVIDNMRMGMAEGIVPPRFLMEQVVEQIKNIKDQEVESLPFMKALEKENVLSEDEQKEKRAELISILTDEVVPAYQKVQDFMTTEYLPACREIPGIHALPNGKERYEYAVRYHTSTSLTPDAIFETECRK